MQIDLEWLGQNQEDRLIFEHFGDVKELTFLELGANDGTTFSNCYNMALVGARGVCVEPSKKVFSTLVKSHLDHTGVHLFNCAISTKCGTAKIFDSNTLLKKADLALVSTLDEEETKRWGSTVHFDSDEVDTLDFENLLDLSPFKKFDVISIDCEGLDYKILSQINLKEVECRLLIVEHNGKDMELYKLYCESFGMKLKHENGENLIFVK
jgi:FkbM family methyltransferase